MQHYKIVFSGPVGAGKTTAITSLSDIPTVRTEARATDETSLRKPMTTVALDFGVLNLNDHEDVHLYGTPGQGRFDFMWDILTEGGLGLVLLLDNTRPAPFHDLRLFLRAFERYIARSAIAIGVTRMDLNPSPGLGAYYDALSGTGLIPPVFEVDARVRADVALLVKALLISLDPIHVEDD